MCHTGGMVVYVDKWIAGFDAAACPVVPYLQVLHVEQEVVGDDTPVVQAVLDCDTERADLLEEEAQLMKKLNKV